MNNYRFGNYLCELREKKNLSQKQLGIQLGISNKTISKWENGGGYPSTELIMPLAKALGISVEELYAAISNDKQEKSKLRRGIDAVVHRSLWIVLTLSAVVAILWALFLFCGDSEDKVRLSAATAVVGLLVYFLTAVTFRYFVKSPIVPSKYVDIMFVFISVSMMLGFVFVAVECLAVFPNMYSPTFAACISAFAGMTQSLKKRI